MTVDDDAPRFLSLRSMVTVVHAIPGAAGELTWPEGDPIAVRAHPAAEVHPCALRRHLAHALAVGSCDELAGHLGRQGEPSARLLADGGRRDLGGGVQRYAFAHQCLDVFVTTLEAHVAGHALLGAATLPTSFRIGPCHQRPPDGFGVGLSFDEVTRVSLVWLAHSARRHDLDEMAAEAAWAMAGACAATEATLGL